ncbi:cytochrome c oxidase subunit II [Nocardioides mesophilus]|uniref:Cytochrome c oxidase subunit 2 n=1 Tax=Nocardioides mesophilus TaxID=433659 RepID=A0A7G9RGN2_9ACTN|nr:cytochrome c oxidase subunit II [Nocardioides mesophilus]
MPEPATDRAQHVYDLWHGAWIAALIIGVLVWGLILYAAFAFRRRSDDEVPVQTRYNLPIEILYTIAPIIIVLVLFYFTVTVQNQVLAPAASENGKDVSGDHQIEVVGYQWSWSFNYLKDDALDGSTNVFTAGTTGDRPTLVLPVGESIDVTLVSPDVIHSFWVPAFLFKMDVVPGRHNSFTFTPTEKGTFDGRCAELCGTYHSRMLFDVKVVSPEDFATYLKSLEDQGNVGIARGGENVDTKVGLEPKSQADATTTEDAQ